MKNIVLSNLDLPEDTGDNRPGEMFAANEARFVSANYSQPLTAYIQGWSDPENLQAILDGVCPPVDVARRFEYKRFDNTEAFQSESDDIRAIGSNFKFVEYKATSVNEKCDNKGLGIRIDHDEGIGDMWQEDAVVRLTQRLLRNELRRALALINAASVNQAVTWSSGTPNPDKDVRDAIRISADAQGLRPNVVSFAEDAFDKRSDAFQAANTPYAGVAAGKTIEELARVYGVDRVIDMRPRYQNTSTAKALAQASNTVLLFNAQAGISKNDPSNIKRFVAPTDSGRFKVYITTKEKYTDIIVEHYSKIAITSALGIRKLTVT